FGFFWCVILVAAPVTAVFAEGKFAAVDRPARTPIQELVDAAGTGDTTTVRRLLDAGAMVSAGLPDTGVQALHQAAANGHVGLVGLLLERGAQVDATDVDGASALVYAAYHGRTKVIEVLLAAGAKVELLPKRQVHALNAAILSGSIDTVKTLVEAGADPDRQDVFGKSAREYAAQVARSDLAALFDASKERAR
ncbi:MAG: ankyrin repeat domain-containing protein, partial [Ahniella sp.]|nr:ankyrin repeat domain-containing protein [Ahniella sp.]